MSEELEKKIDEIIDIIKTSSEYQDYQYLKNKLEQNKRIKDQVDEIKKIQKELVKKEYVKEDVSTLEKEYQKKLEELEEIPLYSDFIETQNKLNKTIKQIEERFQKYFDQKTN